MPVGALNPHLDMFITFAANLLDRKKEMIPVIALRSFHRKEDIVAPYPGLVHASTRESGDDVLQKAAVLIPIWTEDAIAEAQSFMRVVVFVLPGKYMGRETDANPAGVTVWRWAPKLEWFKVRQRNLFPADEEWMPVDVLRRRRIQQ